MDEPLRQDEPRPESRDEEERETPLVDKGSASGSVGVSGTRATDFRPGKAERTPLDDDESDTPA